MKKFLSFLLVMAILYLGLAYRHQITEYVFINFLNKDMIVVGTNNIYSKTSTVYKEADNYYPKTKEDIINIFYTALNGGWERVVFFCTSKYEGCINDVTDLSNSNDFNKINNFVHPYNSYKTLYLNYNNLGKVEINIDRIYGTEEIVLIEQKASEIIQNNIDKTMNDKEKIKTIHDYIINTTVYDEEAANKVESGDVIDFTSHKASGALLNGKAICGGYSDAMAIFLNKFNIDNYKIASEKHIWNYVKLNNEWLHLDLTWDDPVTTNKDNILLDTFFLVTDDKLKELDTSQHTY